MSFEEVTTVSPEVFLSRKCQLVDAKLVAKITGLLEGYECFNEASRVKSGIPFNVGKSASHYRRGHHKHREYRHRPTPKPLTLDRQVLSLLNKLSKHNFSKLCTKMQDLVNEETVVHVLDQIMLKCYQQICFLKLYVMLIRELHDNASIDIQQKIKQRLHEHIDDIMQRQGTVSQSFNLSATNYDDFCNSIGLKSFIIGMHKTALALLQSPRLICNDGEPMKVYFDRIFTQTTELGERDAATRNTDLHELMLELLMDFTMLDLKWRKKINDYFGNKANTATFSSKARFKIMDVIDK